MTNHTIMERKDAPKESTWGYEAVFPNWEAWEEEYRTLQRQIAELKRHAGILGESPERLANWFTVYSKTYRQALKLFDFARTAYSVDSSDIPAKNHLGQITGLYAQFQAEAAFAKPEMLSIGDTLMTWAEEHKELERYRHYFEDLLRLKPHQRSAEVESLLNRFEELLFSVEHTWDELANADLRFEDAVDMQGKSHPVHQATIDEVLQSPDREFRRAAWENYYDSHLAFQNTLASNYLTNVRQFVFLAKARNFDSGLALMLSPSNLPVETFHTLVDTFQRHLPVWHRYWEIRRKLLSVDTLHPYDIWAPIGKNPPNIPFRQGVDWICDSLAPLGEDYVRVLRRGCLDERWVDYAPTIGKVQGAASTLRVDKPPFIYMSYDNSVASVGVLAHELGHSMHHVYMDEHQPIVYANFDSGSSAVAETASNFHQAMLRAYLWENMPDDRDIQIAVIEEAIFNFHRYFFIMPTLARFEQEVFYRVWENQPISAGTLNQIMRDLFAEGYGETMADDPTRTAITWAQFGHLYYPFYTFQYSIGISAANAIANRVLAGEPGAADDYLSFLSAGSSLYPMDLYKKAGVDMSTPEPIEKAFGMLSRLIDRLETFV